MENNNQKPNREDDSPIRGIFRKNEEAYNNHQRELEKERQEQIARDRLEAQEQEKSDAAVKDKPDTEKNGFKIKIKSFFSKLAEIITQPEDSSFVFDDDEDLDDIITDGNTEADDGRIHDIITQEKPDEHEVTSLQYAPEFETRTVLYSAHDEENKSTVEQEKTDNEMPAAEHKINEEEKTGSVVLNNDGNPSENQDIAEKTDKEDIEDNKTDTVPVNEESKPQIRVNGDGKTEITLDAILQAKNSAALKTPITYIPTAAVQPKVSELSHEPAAPKAAVQPPRMQVTDFAEGRREPMIYRHNDSVPFVVMAGKFTRTVRTEYEYIRKLRDKINKNNRPMHTEAQIADTELNPAESEAKKPVQSVKKKNKNSVSHEIKSADQDEKQDFSEEKAVKEKPVKKEKKPIVLKPKKKFGASIKALFSAEGDVFDEEEDFIEEKPEISDYGSEEDAAEIKNDITINFSRIFARTIVLAVTTVLSITLALLAQLMPSLFLEKLRNGWLVYGILSFLLTAVTVFASRYTIVNGLMPLRKVKGNSDTAPAAAAVAAAIQSVTALFLPNVYLDGRYHLYICLAAIALLFNSIGKLLIIARTADNFKFLCSGKAKCAGKIYSDTLNADKLCSGLPIHRPIIAYMKKSGFMSNFLHLSYASDPVEDNASFMAPFTVVLSVMCAAAYGFMRNDFIGGVSSFAVTSFITVPLCSLIALNIPIRNLCRSTLKKGAMVVGYEAVNQFCDTNAVMIDAAQLYPKGSIILSGIKPYNESKLNDALLAGASVTFAVNGALTHVFETIIQDRKHMVPDVDSVSYDDEMGLSGWIGGQRILLGNRALMEKHNIDMPDESAEKKYRRMGNEISYISMSGELIAMFVLTYKVDRGIAHALRELTDNGVNIIVRTIDPNITQAHVADKFSLYQRCIKILPTGLGTICHNELKQTEKSSRAYVATNGRITAFSAAVSGCIKIRSTVTIARIIQVLAILIGFMLISVISFVSGFAKLGNGELLLYTGFWCAALILVSAVARKLS